MTQSPIFSENPLYQLLREGKVEEFNQRIIKGDTVDLSNCDFRSVDLRGLEAKDLDFSNSYFNHTDLRGVDFSQCKNMEGASIHESKISGTYFPKQISAHEILLSLEHGTRIRYSI